MPLMKQKCTDTKDRRITYFGFSPVHFILAVEVPMHVLQVKKPHSVGDFVDIKQKKIITNIVL